MKKNILWVDDEIELLESHIIYLSEKGYNVLKVNSNEETFTIFELFDTISNDLWVELDKLNEINSFRRETQSLYKESE